MEPQASRSGNLAKGLMSVQGQTQKSGRAPGRSALPSGTDTLTLAAQVRKVPNAEVLASLGEQLVADVTRGRC